MKPTIFTVALAASVLFATPVLAQQPNSPEKNAQAKPSVPNVAEYDKQMALAQENMKKMQELLPAA